nr:MADS-box transcription factor MADS-MC [Ipomoea batatas]
MEMIIDRYERYSYAEKRLLAETNDSESSDNWSLEYAKLKGKIDLLQRNHKHYMGEDLDSMSQKDLQNLEQQLDSSLRLIRSRRVFSKRSLKCITSKLSVSVLQNQLLYASLSELQKTEKAILQENNMLAKKIKEKEKMAAQQAQWEQNQGPSSNSFLSPQPLPCLNIGLLQRPVRLGGVWISLFIEATQKSNCLRCHDSSYTFEALLLRHSCTTCLVAFLVSVVRFLPEAITSPSSTMTQPTGTSRLSNASFACSRASFIKENTSSPYDPI